MSKKQEAEEFVLRSISKGPLTQIKVVDKGMNHGFSKTTLNNACRALQDKKIVIGYKRDKFRSTTLRLIDALQPQDEVKPIQVVEAKTSIEISRYMMQEGKSPGRELYFALLDEQLGMCQTIRQLLDDNEKLRKEVNYYKEKESIDKMNGDRALMEKAEQVASVVHSSGG